MSTPGKVVVHVGPPKTATTALQRTLQSLGSDAFVYGGVTQPRRRDELELSQRLHLSSYTDVEDINELRKDVEKQIGSGRDLLVSEEMLLVDSPVAHQEKLRKIRAVLEGFDVVIVVCVRDPVAGLQSLYQEIYRNLRIAEKLSFRLFLASNQAKVFDYRALEESILEAGFENIVFIQFEALVGDELRLSTLVDTALRDDPQLTLKPANQSQLTQANRRRLAGPSIQDLTGWRRFLPESLLDKAKRTPIVNRAWRAVASLPIAIGRARNLEVPKELATRLRADAQRVQR